MSTRANVIITGSYGDELIFYRHSDGYPSGTLPTLEKFLDYLKEGKIRDNVVQSSGWLVMLGNDEYGAGAAPSGEIFGWKVGAYEPTVGIHGDIEYLYVIDLEAKTISIDGEDGYRYSGKFRS